MKQEETNYFKIIMIIILTIFFGIIVIIPVIMLGITITNNNICKEKGYDGETENINIESGYIECYNKAYVDHELKYQKEIIKR